MNTSTQERKPGSATEPTAGSVMLFLGIALVILGIIALATTITFTLATIMVLGVLLVAAAIAEFVHAFRARGQRGVGMSILSGIVYLITGALLLANPIIGAISVTALIGSFLLVAGVVRMVRAIQIRHRRNWGWMLVAGLMNIVLGVLIWAGWPVTGLWVIGLFVGIELMLSGFASIGLGLAASRVEDRTA